MHVNLVQKWDTQSGVLLLCVEKKGGHSVVVVCVWRVVCVYGKKNGHGSAVDIKHPDQSNVFLGTSP